MKIDNKTCWRTDDLRKLIRLCVLHEGLVMKGRWQVSIVHTRQERGCSGEAYLNSRWMKLRLPKADGAALLPIRFIASFLRVTIHEIGHCKGLTHDEMPKSRDLSLDWIEPANLQVRRKVDRQKPKPTRESKARETLARIDGLLEAAEKKHKAHMKGLRTRRAAAKRSVTYYDRKKRNQG